MTTATLPRPDATTLTDADRDLIRMLADGASSKQIGRRLALSIDAVEKRTSRLHAKTGARNTPHMIASALRYGWLDEAQPAATRHRDTPELIAERRAALLADLDQWQADRRLGREYVGILNPAYHDLAVKRFVQGVLDPEAGAA